MNHFTFTEITSSQTATLKHIDNTPSEQHRKNIEEAVSVLLDPLREAWAVCCANEEWGTPALRVTSGYRSPELNRAVGGSPTSAHCVGFAFDLVPVNGRIADFKTCVRDFLKDRNFDQLISEYEDDKGTPEWIHVGYKTQRGKQRRQMLSMRNGGYYPLSA